MAPVTRKKAGSGAEAQSGSGTLPFEVAPPPEEPIAKDALPEGGEDDSDRVSLGLEVERSVRACRYGVRQEIAYMDDLIEVIRSLWLLILVG